MTHALLVDLYIKPERAEAFANANVLAREWIVRKTARTHVLMEA